MNALTLLGWCEAWDQYTRTMKIWEGTITLPSYPMFFCALMPSAMLFFTDTFLIDEVLLSHNKYFQVECFPLFARYVLLCLLKCIPFFYIRRFKSDEERSPVEETFPHLLITACPDCQPTIGCSRFDPVYL